MRLTVFAVFVIAMLPTLADGAVFVNEPFDVNAGGLNGQGSGTGWNGNWTGFGGAASVSSGSLDFAGNSALTATGNKAEGGPGTIIFRDKAGAIDMTVDATYYVTFLLNRTSSASDISQFTIGTGAGQTVAIGTSSSGFTRIGIDDGGTMIYNPTIPSSNPKRFINDGRTYQFVAKLVTRSGDVPDELYLKLFDTATESLPAFEPTIWDASVFVDNDRAPGGQNPIILLAGDDTTIDEFGIYTAYSDIAVVPEPSGLFAFLTVGGCGLASRRKRRG